MFSIVEPPAKPGNTADILHARQILSVRLIKHKDVDGVIIVYPPSGLVILRKANES